MDRRNFLQMGSNAKNLATAPRRVTGTLAPYQGPWTKTQAAHLARRCLFGPTATEIEQLTSLGFTAAMDQIMTLPSQAPAMPLNSDYPDDPNVPIGTTWVDKLHTPGTPFRWRRSLRAWWVSLMLHSGTHLREKMTLFWHNHFATGLVIYKDARFAYRHLELMRSHALGNFKTLVEEMTIDPAMLRFLNGNSNVQGAPNENYARELFELFTIGKGPQVGPGDYTNYTETDVLEAAKVLTGWKDLGYFNKNRLPGVQFTPNDHDTSQKTFSSAFNQYSIFDQGDQEYKSLIEMIFQQKETARYICRKLYRWFVYYEIDAGAEQDVIEPMATMLYDGQYEMAPVIRALLSSQHFYDANNIGGLIKNPVDFILSPVRQLELELPDATQDLKGYYDIHFRLYQLAQGAQMDLLDPPSVAGWPAYYQGPQFHQLWANSATLPNRLDFTQRITRNGLFYRQIKLQVDALGWLAKVSDPSDPNLVVGEMAELLLPQPLPTSQFDFLKDSLIPGLPDYEWTMEYNRYANDPTNNGLATPIRNKVKALMEAMLGLPEFHLS